MQVRREVDFDEVGQNMLDHNPYTAVPENPWTQH
jgi:hypothetical protein